MERTPAPHSLSRAWRCTSALAEQSQPCSPATNTRPRAARTRSQNAREEDGPFKGVDALVIDAGEADEDKLYSKSQSLQTWLLGWEFPETIIVVGNRSVTMLSSKKKGAHSTPPAGTAPAPAAAPTPRGACLCRPAVLPRDGHHTTPT